MALISVTRLRLASVRYLPGFAWYAVRSSRQARRAPGFLGMRLLPDQRLAFWTATAWTDLASMKAYMTAGPHRAAMPKLARWCDEGSVVHWVGGMDALDDWAGAHARMVADGRASPVRHPSPAQRTRDWPAPRGSGSRG